jgi:RimJ/RimL family protein N-acetyltransferase
MGRLMSAPSASLCLRGPRVLLREWRDDDLPAFNAMNADAQVMRHFPALLSADESATALSRIRKFMVEHGWGLWCADISGECAGFIGLSKPNFEAHFMPCVEIGWRLRQQFWGQGYASEGARLALAYGFDQLGLEEIVSFTAAVNTPSIAVMQRIGMQRDADGDFDHPRVPEGNALRPHVLYRMQRGEWSTHSAT